MRNWGTLLQDALNEKKAHFVRVLLEFGYICNNLKSSFPVGGSKKSLSALFSGPYGVQGKSENNANLAATQKLLMKMGPTQLDY